MDALSEIAAELSAERIATHLHEMLLDANVDSAHGLLDKFPWE